MSEEISKWSKKDLWKRQSASFVVEVSRHTVKSSMDPYEGENRWAVYAYIYPNHRLFERFDGDSMFQDATACLPLHGGPSYLRINRNNKGEIASYQVGADYHHIHDDRFTHYADEKDAYQVFSDADKLFAHLEGQP